MKVLSTKLDQFSDIFTHPSAILFRSIELKTLYDVCKDYTFEQPSLDLGCGNGQIANVLFDEKLTYGLDNDEAGDVKESIEKELYEKVIIESAEAMSLADNSLNFVFSNCVIEHIPGIDSVLKEVSRVMKPGGYFVFNTPSHKFSDYLYLFNTLSSMGMKSLAVGYAQKRNAMLNHYNMHSYEGWKEKLEKCGLEVVEHSYYLSKEALMLWDKIALDVFIKRKFTKKAENNAHKRYKEDIQKIYNKAVSNKNDGAAILIVARKN